MSSIELLFYFQVRDVRRVLTLLERIHSQHLETCGVICMKLLVTTKEPYLAFEISQFASFVYTKIRLEGIDLSEDHQAQLLKFSEDLEAGIRYISLETRFIISKRFTSLKIRISQRVFYVGIQD